MSGHRLMSGGFMTGGDLHRECWDLLPWLANERANPKDLARIEAHLRACVECQQELANQRRLRDAIRAEDPVVIAPQTSLQKLMQRIDNEETATPVETDVPRADAPKPVIAWPRWLGVAAAVQGIAIVALVAALWMQARETLEAPRFTTLTSHAAIPQGPVIRVVFVDGVALEDVNAILRSINAQVVAGPSEAGVYTLTLSSSKARRGNVDSRVNETLAQLRSDDRVVFAESAIAKTGSP